METLIVLGVVGLFFLVMLFSMVFIVNSGEAKIVERLGKFNSVATEGLNFKIPFIDSIVAERSLRIDQLDVEVETKTKDNVFVKTKVSVQYQVMKDKVAESYYKLTDPESQIESYVFDVVRSEIPKLTLDEVFIEKDKVANAVKQELADAMDDYGFSIVKSLITDIDPDEKVKASMNEINAAERQRDAAMATAEAKKIATIKEAEAEAESKRLQGKGLADQRKEIANGLKESIESLKNTGIDNDEIMTLLLVTQHYDAVEAVSKNAETNTIMLPYSANNVTSMREQMSEAILSTKKLKSERLSK